MTAIRYAPDLTRQLRDLRDQVDAIRRTDRPSGFVLDAAGRPSFPSGIVVGGGSGLPREVASQNIPAPSAPTLTTKARGNDVWIEASWVAPSGPGATAVVGYLVEYRETDPDAPVASQFQPTTGFTASLPVFAAREYQVRVAGTNRLGDPGDWSDWATITAATDTVAPATAPGNFTVGAGYRSVTGTWDPVDEPDVTYGGGYQFNLSTAATTDPGTGKFTTTIRSTQVAATVASFTDLGDYTGQTLHAQVAAVDASGNVGPYSPTVTVIPGEPTTATDGQPPPALASAPTITAGIGYLLAEWAPVTNPDPVTYDVHLSTTSGFTPDGTNRVASVGSDYAFLRTNAAGAVLARDTTYHVKVVPRDPDGAAAASAQASGQVARAAADDLADILVGGGNRLRRSSYEGDAYTYLIGRPGAELVSIWSAALATSTTEALFGTQSLRITDSGNGNGGMAHAWPEGEKLAAGQTAVGSAYVKGPAGQPFTCGMRAYSVTGSTVLAGFAASRSYTFTGGWQRVVSQQYAYQGSDWRPVLDIRLAGATAGTVYYIDGVKLEAGNLASSYAPRVDEVLPGTIGTTEIAPGAVTTPLLAANAVTATKMVLADWTNLVENPSGTSGTNAGWVGGASTPTVVTAATSGVPANAPTPYVVAQTAKDAYSEKWAPVTPGEKFYVEATAAQSTASQPFRVGVQFELRDPSTGAISYSWVAPTAQLTAGTSTWTKISGQATAPATAVRGRFWAQINATSGFGTWYHVGHRLNRAAGAELLVDGSITASSAVIADGAIGTAKIGSLAVTTAKLADASVQTAKIGDAQVTTAKIAALAVGTAQIADAAIDTAKIADAAITTLKVADAAITNAKINDLDVGKLNAGSLKVGSYIRSSNWVAGTSGWSIDADGNAEFNNVALRGDLSRTGTVDQWSTTLLIGNLGPGGNARINWTFPNYTLFTVPQIYGQLGAVNAVTYPVMGLTSGRVSVSDADAGISLWGEAPAQQKSLAAVSGQRVEFWFGDSTNPGSELRCRPGGGLLHKGPSGTNTEWLRWERASDATWMGGVKNTDLRHVFIQSRSCGVKLLGEGTWEIQGRNWADSGYVSFRALSYEPGSDARMKSNRARFTEALPIIRRMPVERYDHNHDRLAPGPPRRRLGITVDLDDPTRPVPPWMTSRDQDGMAGIDLYAVAALAVAGVQELLREHNRLAHRVAVLEADPGSGRRRNPSGRS